MLSLAVWTYYVEHSVGHVLHHFIQLAHRLRVVHLRLENAFPLTDLLLVDSSWIAIGVLQNG